MDASASNEVSFAQAARDELDEAIGYYNGVRSGLGDEFKAEIEAAVNRVVFWPHAWSRASKEARLCAAHRFPYGVVYVVEADRIVIVAVMHLHRRRGYWRNRVKDLGP